MLAKCGSGGEDSGIGLMGELAELYLRDQSESKLSNSEMVSRLEKSDT